MKAPLTIRLKNSFKGFISVFKNPLYILFALVLSFLISGFVIWSLNFDLVRYIIVDAPISAFDKLRFFWDVQTGIYSAYSSPQATGILLFGLLFGINGAMILKVIRSGTLKSVPKKSGSASFLFAVLSGGCVACGTSILAPFLATLGATSSAFTSELSNWLNWISIVLITYSIYKLGEVINNSKNTPSRKTKT